MSLPDILSTLVIFVALPLTWAVAILLWSLSRRDRDIRLLRAHAISATALALIVTVFALVFVNNSMAEPLLNLPATQIITRGSLLILSTLSALYWLRVVWRAQ